jgi:hypothetical protein
MELTGAIDVALRLRDALAHEVERARGERHHLSTLDFTSLFRDAETRAEFNATAARLQHDLASCLTAVATQRGLSQLTLEHLAAISPRNAAVLSRLFAEIRSLAAALSEIDQLNRSIAERALSCVESYLQTVSFTPQAYDRRGLNLSALHVRTTHSMRA